MYRQQVGRKRFEQHVDCLDAPTMSSNHLSGYEHSAMNRAIGNQLHTKNFKCLDRASSLCHKN